MGTVQVYKSTDQGAPSLSGTAGALITVLDAVLVNGYNSTSVTSITRSGSTATLTASSVHGFSTGQTIVVAGANESEYNGTFVCTVTSTTVLTYTVSGTPATPATGTITVKRAPAGAGTAWAKAYSGTNLAAYRPGAGTRFYLRVDDTGTTNGRCVGYETMSDVNTGTGPFPTAAQFSGGMYWPKSSTADATARAWIISATDRLLIMHVSSAGTANATDASVCVWGDLKTYKSGDAYHCIHIGATSATTTSSNSFFTLTGITSTSTGHYCARSYTQLGTSLAVGKHSDGVKGSVSTMGSGGLAYPNGPDGGLYLAPVWIHETAGPSVRGTIPGLWAPLHTRPLEHLDTVSGTGSLSGKTFLALKMYTGAETFLETSDTWDV
jgi:hypothetical protein